MTLKSYVQRSYAVILLLALAFGTLGGSVVNAAQTGPEGTVPEGLSAEDWNQIKTLLSPTQQAYLKASNTDPSDLFGYSVAISGDTLVVGAPWEASNATGVNGDESNNSAGCSGAAYVFVRSGGSWSQQAYLKASNPDVADSFGGALAIDGDTIVVGAVSESSNATGVNGNGADNSAGGSGAAYVFVRNVGTWSQQAYLKASNTGTHDNFGTSVSISGDTIVVGALQEDSNATGVDGDQNDNSETDSGAAYVFTRSGATWSQQAYLKASNTDPDDWFGTSVAISGETLVVGAFFEDSNATGVDGDQNNNSAPGSGAAYVFTRSGTTWSQGAYLKASNTGVGDYFGYSVSISGETLVIGAYFEDSNATGVNGDQNNSFALDSGAAYVFVRSGTTWSQQAYLKASNTDSADRFGWSVSISGDRLVVGAHQESSNATGVNGNQADNSAYMSGAAYVFVRSGTTWSQQAYLKASNTGTYDYFGYAVAISGDTVLVGAWGEDSNATGVDGDQNDNSAGASGAAYVYYFPPNNPPTNITLSSSSAAENQSVGTTIGTLTTTDADAGDTHTYSLACTVPGADDASFSISGDALNTAAVFDYETKNSYVVCVRTDDGNGGIFDKNFTITVTDENDIPTNISLTDSSLPENQPIGTTIASITTTDQDSGDMHVYSLTCSTPGADDASFQTSGASGHVLQNLVVFDYETKNSYEVCIRTDDGRGGTFDKDFIITVTDVNEPPTDISLSNASVAEAQPVGTTVGTFTTTDPDAGDTHTYSFACTVPGTDDASFTLDGDTLKTAEVFDYETKNTYDLCIRTTDAGGLSFDENFTINVTDGIDILTATFRSAGIYDGHVLESGEFTNLGGTLDRTSPTFILGDGAGDKQYRAILHFNTGPLPDNAVITRVTLKIRRQSVLGTNPFTILGRLIVDIRKPFFGTIYGLETRDFQAAAGRNAVALFGITPVNYWYSANLNATGRAYVNKAGVTQFRLRFYKDDNNDNAADYMKFYSGNYVGVLARPTLVIEYYIP